MTDSSTSAGGATGPSSDADRRYVGYFCALDAWTEYWDVYHPESKGRYYFGDGGDEPGLLRSLLPRDGMPPTFSAWVRMALGTGERERFESAIREPQPAAAVEEVDRLLDRLFTAHFGDPADPVTQADYLRAIFRFATNDLPPATERDALIAVDDPRKPTAGRHRLEGDLMWFAWSMVLEGAEIVCGHDHGHARRSLMLAGVSSGCPADFVWRGHRRSRRIYAADAATVALLQARGLIWAGDFDAAADEVHALYRIREWGEES